MSDAPAVFTIPAGQSFVDTLARGLLRRHADSPERLAAATVLLPTRRACRALQAAFLRASEGAPLLLPRLLPLGDLDPEELLFDSPFVGGSDAEATLPPAMPAVQRQLLLAECILRHDRTHAAESGAVAMNEDQAIRLAAELGRLLDQVETEGLDFADLAGLVPEDYAVHWQITLRFLAIVTEVWPGILAGFGCIGPAERRRRLAELQAETWRRRPPADPVIAAGSTGSIPATAELLRRVAFLPQGSVILPGLDRESDAETWAEIGGDPGHPQYGMAQLLGRLGIGREAVAAWEVEAAPQVDPARARFANLALRPPRATARWHAARREDFATALDGVQRIDCADSGEEALVIALLLRRQAEQPGSTAALITPDRDLARRVAMNLQRWDIEVDDSAGRSLANTPPGVFLRLTGEMAAERFAPVALLAALKHPLAAGGQSPAAFRRNVRALELAVLRGPRPAPGLDGLRAALAESKAGAEIKQWFEALAEILRPFAESLRTSTDLSEIVDSHIAAVEALAASTEEAGAARLWAGEAGEAAAAFLAELREAAQGTSVTRGFHYPAALEALMAGRAVRPSYGLHPRIAILGPLEARLQHADVLVLGGLNEGTWPAQVDPGPWLSRPMQADFGLPLPERRIGLAAHDFYQGFCAPRVYLTRAERVEGTPSVPARWLRRIAALRDGLGLENDLQGETAQLRAWAAALDQPAEVAPMQEPRPTPPVEVRPRELSVTRIETWMGDPYALYAREILRLYPLDPLDADPGAAERGTLVHAALERFLKLHPKDLPPQALDDLLAIGDDVFRPIQAKPGAYAFWWPRFLRVARWFIAEERARRAEIAESHVEITGRLQFDAPGGRFTLKAKADRIDRRRDGSLEIIDYKTGLPPDKKRVDRGFVPQLPLEAAIAAAGGFAALPAAPVGALTFWRHAARPDPGRQQGRSRDPGHRGPGRPEALGGGVRQSGHALPLPAAPGAGAALQRL